MKTNDVGPEAFAAAPWLGRSAPQTEPAPATTPAGKNGRLWRGLERLFYRTLCCRPDGNWLQRRWYVLSGNIAAYCHKQTCPKCRARLGLSGPNRCKLSDGPPDQLSNCGALPRDVRSSAGLDPDAGSFGNDARL